MTDSAAPAIEESRLDIALGKGREPDLLIETTYEDCRCRSTRSHPVRLEVGRAETALAIPRRAVGLRACRSVAELPLFRSNDGILRSDKSRRSNDSASDRIEE